MLVVAFTVCDVYLKLLISAREFGTLDLRLNLGQPGKQPWEECEGNRIHQRPYDETAALAIVLLDLKLHLLQYCTFGDQKVK
jgi:hypothetical protein